MTEEDQPTFAHGVGWYVEAREAGAGMLGAVNEWFTTIRGGSPWAVFSIDFLFFVFVFFCFFVFLFFCFIFSLFFPYFLFFYFLIPRFFLFCGDPSQKIRFCFMHVIRSAYLTAIRPGNGR